MEMSVSYTHLTLIGANGAGKSTTLRTISGLVKAKSGSITYNGEELIGKPINAILAAGIAQVPEGRRVFPDMTVLENLKIGAYLRKDKEEIEKDIEWVYELFPRLKAVSYTHLSKRRSSARAARSLRCTASARTRCFCRRTARACVY